MSIINFPGVDKPVHGDEDRDMGAAELLASFTEKASDTEVLLIVGVDKTGALSWGTTSSDIREAIWLSIAAQRILVDASLGITEL